MLRPAPTSDSRESVHGQSGREVTYLQSTSDDIDAIGIIRAEHADLVLQIQMLVALSTADERIRLWEGLRVALELHIAVESEVFYPAFLDVTENSLTHFVATVEHENIIAQIAEVSAARPGSADFQSRARSLARAFMHHVRELEKEGGMFKEALGSTMNRDAVGRRIISRKKLGIEAGTFLVAPRFGVQRT
jgi:hypothetical protein